MVGSLVAGRADIGGSPLYLWADRQAVVSYTTETWIERSYFIFKQPRKNEDVSFVLLTPFSDWIWIGLAGFGLGFVVFVSGLMWIEFSGA